MLRRSDSVARALRRRLRRWGHLAPTAFTLAAAIKGLHPALPGWPCPLRSLTGIPCPTCFLTRATAAALCGQLELAVRLHPFGPPLAMALLVWSVAAIRRRRLVPFRWRASIVVPFALGFLGTWLLRLILQFGLGLQAFP